MRRELSFTLWKIICRSSSEARTLEQWLTGRVDLNRTVVDTIRTTPNGVEQVQAVPHRLGDYFAGIRVLPDRSELQCLRLAHV